MRIDENGVYDLIIDAKVAEKTAWGLTTVYRLVSDEPGVELKMTLTNSEVDLPLSEGDSVVIGVSCDAPEEEEEPDDGFNVPPGPDGTKCPYGRCDGSGVIPRRWGKGVYDVDLEPCECGIDRIVAEHAARGEPFGSPGPHGRCPRCDNRGVTLDGEPCDCLERP